MDNIRRMIDRHTMNPGDRLPGELEWARRLSVSRTVVREAVGRLQSLGLVTVSRGRGRGMAVGNSDSIACGMRSIGAMLKTGPSDVRQLFEFRAALESHAARLAAKCATPEQLAELNAMADAIEAPGRSEEAKIEADFAFHRCIAEITGNSVIQNALVVSQELIAAGIRENWRRHRGRGIDTRKEHRRIVAALRSGDPDAAQRAMLAHVQPEKITPATPLAKRRSRASVRAAKG